MVRILKKRTMLLISLLLSMLVFFSGFLLGSGLDNARINDVVKELERNELQRENYVTEQRFLELFAGENCELVPVGLGDLSKNLAETGKILTDYEARGIFNEKEYKELKERYFLSEIKLYVLLKELKNNCNLDTTVILFFYDQNDRKSIEQGYVLDNIVRRLQNITVLSIDRESSSSPSVKTVMNYYNITSSPTIIVNFNKKIEGFTEIDKIINITNKN